MKSCIYLVAALGLFVSPLVSASSVLPMTVEEELDHAPGAFRAQVSSNQSFRNAADGHIYTTTVVQMTERLKGKFPLTVQLVHRGGQVDSFGETDDLSPKFDVGKEYLVIVGRRRDGTLFALRGAVSAKVLERSGGGDFVPAARSLMERVRSHFGRKSTDLRGQNLPLASSPSFTVPTGGSYVTGLMVDSNNISARFLQPDRGEPIPYLIDMQSLPNGVMPQQALVAVQNALAAWSAVTSLTFVYQGTANFGAAAPNVVASDNTIRIQLHDNYNYIPGGAGILGEGGRTYTDGGYSTGGSGANVAGNEFHHSLSGYVVLKNTEPALQNLKTLEEVLCHEIGHVLSMAHSSEVFPAPTNTLFQSIMYFQVHSDGRGALLGAYDPPTIQQVHPPDDTPPFGYDRYLDVVDSVPNQPNIAGVNEVQAPGYDLQTAPGSLTRTITSQTFGYGTFSFVGSTLKYATYYFGDADRLDPASNSYYEQATIRVSDGVNVSPFIDVRVISFAADSFPATSDGIPDSWMLTYFGSADPTTGPNRGANADYDGDGKTNLQEFLSGTSPIDRNSVLKITSFSKTGLQWNARPYDLYEIQSSTDLAAWTRLIDVVAASTVGAVSIVPDASTKKFYRLQRVR